jgi:Ca-activated chloride channel family protein
MFIKFRYKAPDGDESRLMTHAVLDQPDRRVSQEFRFQMAVAEFALLLRESEFAGGASVAHVLEQARAARGRDENGYRAEFVRLVEAARALDLGVVAKR